MSDSKLNFDNNSRGNWKKCFLKYILAVLTVLCGVRGAIYISGAGKALQRILRAEMQMPRSLPKFSEPLEFNNAAVAADYKTCSEYGVKILRDQKGNAVDAAIATALCVGVVNAHSAGIGGGGFMIIYDKKTGRTTAINFREIAAELEHAETMQEFQHLIQHWMERDSRTKVSGEGEFIGVPGELRGFELAWTKYGRLRWKDLFQPAIEIATKGFPATHALVAAVRLTAANITHDAGLSMTFKPNGQFIKDGDVIKRTKYGETLQKIADSGSADIFYTGKMAKQVVKDVRSVGSKISLKDLKEYKATEVKPLETALPGVKGGKILTVPPPAGGAALINILNILKGFNFSVNDMKERPVLTYHRIIEAFNFVAAKQTFLMDPDFNNKVNQVVKEMLDPEKGEELRKLIDDKTHNYDYYGPVDYYVDIADGTTHLSVLDEEGNAVSLTASLKKYFGAKMKSPELGVIYNDELWDAFDLRLKQFNLAIDSLKPHQRPVSLASPSIILDEAGNVKMVFGAAGGKQIVTALAQVLMNYFWFGDNLKDAVSKPRLHSQLFPNMVVVERNFPERYIEGLRRYGHHVTNDTVIFVGLPYHALGIVQLVVRNENGEILALADHRKGGVAAGYR